MTTFGMAVLYTTYIGGDTWERAYHANRFLATTTPFLIVLALQLTHARMHRVEGRGLASPLVVTALGVLIGLGLSGRSFHEWLQSDVKHSKLFYMVALGENLREQAPPEARVAVVWAGALPYFSRLYAIDLLGKSDKVIARSTPHGISPGHNKWNYAHSIGGLQPDYIIELWSPSAQDVDLVTGLGYSQAANGIYFRSPARPWSTAIGEGIRPLSESAATVPP
jgi:hypothetical protein